jgi:hemerythrin superfamily protein
MDALLLLTADHNRVRGLFARFEAAEESDDTEEMGTLATKILEELAVHTTIEEQVFYPAVDQADEEVHEVVVEGIEEHHVVKELAKEIQALEPGDEVWVAKMKVMMENVEHHADEEEQELFPEVRKALDSATLEDLGQRLEALKAELGAPTVADKEHFTVEQLHELARDQEIPGRSSMDRDELVATVSPS